MAATATPGTASVPSASMSMPAPPSLTQVYRRPPTQHSRNNSPGEGSSSQSSSRQDSSYGGTSASSQMNPPVIVKHEPQSPSESKTLPAPPRPRSPRRRRPQGLDLQQSNRVPSGGLTKDPTLSNLAMACLSPGFRTNDPALQDTISRSLEVIDKQRKIIEARQNGKPDPPMARRKAPPPRLSLRATSMNLMPPNERAIRSAPLNSSFTGLNRNPAFLPGHGGGETGLIGQSSRLPPISNLLSQSRPGGAASIQTSSQTITSSVFPVSPRIGQGRPVATQFVPAPPPPGAGQPFHSPSFRPPSGHGMAALPRPTNLPPLNREYGPDEGSSSNSYYTHGPESRAVTFSHGRPPSPPASAVHHPTFSAYHDEPPAPPGPYSQPMSELGPPPAPPVDTHRQASRRRPRDEYERETGSPPLGHGFDNRRRPPFDGRDGESKKQEFLSLCARAWDLFHS